MFHTYWRAYTGLESNSTSINVISNNLANVNTVGFKRSEAEFAQLLQSRLDGRSGNGNGIQIGLGSTRTAIRASFEQGAIQPTGQNSNLGLVGSGFFQVVDGGPNGTGEVFYTRAGNFSFNNEGYLVSATGQRVQGYMGTNADGTADVSGGLTDLQVDFSNPAPPRETSIVRFISNLSADAVEGDTFSTELDIFDGEGNEHRLRVTFERGADPGTWSCNFNTDIGEVAMGSTGTSGGTLTFDNRGNLLAIDGASVTGSDFPDPTMTISGLGEGVEDLNVTWDLIDESSIAETENVGFVSNFSGTSTAGTFFQDGYGTGNLQRVDFDQNGTMVGFFDNGVVASLGRVGIAMFNNPNGLKQVNGNLFSASNVSGDALFDPTNGNGRGSVQSASIEKSNVDIGTELTGLIVHQRGYQSNTKAITTADQVMQEILNLKR
jgi:flagellar hook protein FlgE